MAGLQADNYADMIVSTQKHLGRFKWTDLSCPYQNLIALPKILKSDKPINRTGIGINWQVMVGTVGTFRWVNPGQSDNYRTADVMKTATAPWRHNNVNYMLIRQFMAMNKEPELIYDMVKAARHGAMVDLAVGLEQAWWSKPADSTDTLTMFGLWYWIVYNATLGLNGGNPSGFTDGAGGLSSTTYGQWKNWTGQWTDMTKADCITKLRYLLTKAEYFPVTGEKPPDYSDGMGREIYSGYDYVIAPMESLLEQQNDSLGNDVASKDGKILIRGMALNRASYLDTQTSAAIVGIDWSQFKPVFLTGEQMYEQGPRIVSGQHTAYATDIDSSMNTVCYNRRTQFLLAKSDPAA